jgi:hypothetical protein
MAIETSIYVILKRALLHGKNVNMKENIKYYEKKKNIYLSYVGKRALFIAHTKLVNLILKTLDIS